MSLLPDILQLQQAANDIVQQAQHQERSLTPRMIRREVELHFSLQLGTLDSEEFKRPLKRAIESAIMLLNDEADTCVGTDSPPKRKCKLEQRRKDTKSMHPSTKRRRDDHFKEYKSAAIINSSDEEGELESPLQGPLSKGLETQSAEELHDGHNSPLVAQTDDSKHQESVVKTMQNSGTKIPVVVGDAPKRRRKQQTNDHERRRKVTKGGKESSSGQSKDEATIKRLKSLVAACGVRKIWSRVFENIDVPAQQIKKLKEILTELGMTGRLSLEQAKRIKEKRELAKELEDVQSFQQSVVNGSARFRNRSKPASENTSSSTEMESDTNSSETEDAVVPKGRKRTAFQSIAAFLEDQSDME